MAPFFLHPGWIFVALVWFASCKHTEPTQPPLGPDPASGEEILLRASVDYLRLRTAPMTDAEVVTSLREEQIVLWRGAISEHLDTIVLRGSPIIAPWREVETLDGLTGWVFAGAMEDWQPGTGVPYQACLESFNQGDFSRFYPCLDGVSQTESRPEYVQEGPSGLRLRLSSGHRDLNHNLKPGPNYRSYQFLTALPQHGVYVVKVNATGGSTFLVVQRSTGESIEVPGIPQVLPFSSSLFCIGADPAHPGAYRLQVVIADGQRLRSALQQEFPEQSLERVEWGRDGLPTVTLRDYRGELSRWTLHREQPNRWTLQTVS